MAQDAQQQGQTPQTQQQTQQIQVVTYEDAQRLATAAANDAANAAGAAAVDGMRSLMAESANATGTVMLTEEQYARFSSLSSAALHGESISIGMSALIAGLLFVLIVTIHWRLR